MKLSATLKTVITATALFVAANAYAAPVAYDPVITKTSPADLMTLHTPQPQIEFQCTLNGINGMILWNTTIPIKNAAGVEISSATFQYATDWYDPTMDDYNIGTLADGGELSPGSYYLDFPANCLYDNNNSPGDASVTNNAFTLPFKILNTGGISYFEVYNIDPSSHEIPSDLDEWAFTISFQNLDYELSIVEDVVNDPEKGPYLSYTNEDSEEQKIYPESFAPSTDTQYENKIFRITFEKMNTRPNGTYTFVLPEGTLSGNDGQSLNDEFTRQYEWYGYLDPNAEGELAIVTAVISQSENGTEIDYNLMDSETKIALIDPEAILKVRVNPTSTEALDFAILDVTGKEEEDYATAEAVWTTYDILPAASGNGLFEKNIYSIDGYKLYEDRDYVLKVVGYATYINPGSKVEFENSPVYSAVFSGATAAIKFSDVNIESIEPAPGSVLNRGDNLVITFTAPVTLTGGEGKSGFSRGNAGWVDFTSMTSNAEKTVWTLAVPNSEINNAVGPNSIEARIWGTDESGNIIRAPKYDVVYDPDLLAYNETVESDNYLVLKYTAYGACKVVTAVPSGEDNPVESLSSIAFSSNTSDINYSNYVTENPKIYNDNDEEVAELVVADWEATQTSGTEPNIRNLEITMPVKPTITTPGTYTVDIPWNLFTIGTESNSTTNAPATLTIVIPETTVISISPSGEEDPVAKLSTIYFFTEDKKEINFNTSVTTNPVILDSEGTEVAQVKIDSLSVSQTSDSDTEDGYPIELTMTVEPEIATNGTYTLALPFNFFTVGTAPDTSVNAAHTYTIVVDTATGVESIVSATPTVTRNDSGLTVKGINDGDEIAVFDVAGTCVAKIIANGNSAEISCQPGIYIVTINGKDAVKAIR